MTAAVFLAVGFAVSRLWALLAVLPGPAGHVRPGSCRPTRGSVTSVP
ncbi:hypothetical protein ACIG47_17320 [Promicromonospora sp. NPDC052451]